MTSIHEIQAKLFRCSAISSLAVGCVYLFRVPSVYRPDVFLINREPGTGQTECERMLAFLIGCVFVMPILGLAISHLKEGTASARRSAAIPPLMVHAACVIGISFLYQDAINPDVVGFEVILVAHMILGNMFFVLYLIACDDPTEDNNDEAGTPPVRRSKLSKKES